MPTQDRYIGIASLADQQFFELLYSETANAIAETLHLRASISATALQGAFNGWIADYYRTIPTRYSDVRRLTLIGKLLVRNLVTRQIVTYTYAMSDENKVIDRQAAVVVNLPDEVTGLAVGAAVYSFEISRLTGDAAILPLSSADWEAAAKAIRRRPVRAADFRRLLKLRVGRLHKPGKG